MSVRRFVGIAACVLSVLVVPQFAFASHDYDDKARLFVYVHTESNSGIAVDPWRFQVYVSGDADASPYQFEGSPNGRMVTLDAYEDFEVSVSERFNYHARYAGMCEGSLKRYETASCYITLTDEWGGGYTHHYSQPWTTTPSPVWYPAEPVSIVQTYIPTQLPNTGFDPSQGPAMIAFAIVFLLGAGLVVYPYARKVVTAIR